MKEFENENWWVIFGVENNLAHSNSSQMQYFDYLILFLFHSLILLWSNFELTIMP